MEKTDRLFDKDSKCKEFDARVLACEPYEDGYRVVLDRTAFFPEGGGQYGDVGTIANRRVLDTQEKKGVIFHYTDGALRVGETVHGALNWETRFDRMQQHSGEHIVSGLVHRRFGYDNVGFHLGAELCTMDFSGPITSEELEEIEIEANRAVVSDLNVNVLLPDRETLSGLDYRSKIEIEGQVRLVEIPGIDLCACCAPHVKTTGEIGLIKFVDMTNYKGGERITMLAGMRARADYESRRKQIRQIGAMLCETEDQVADGVKRLKETEHALRGQIDALTQKLLTYKAAEADVSAPLTAVFDAELSGSAPRELMNRILERGAAVCAVFAGEDTGGYRYVIGSRSEDVRPLSKKLNEAFDGRGGGKPGMVQGSLKGTKEDILKLL